MKGLADDRASEDDLSRCQELVVLTFHAVLHRDPDEVAVAAFGKALYGGMTMSEFLTELMSTQEFRTSNSPVKSWVNDTEPADLLAFCVALLQARLVEKGCRLQLGPITDPAARHIIGATKMERIMQTLAVLDSL